MGRRKLALKLISNIRSRKITYEKRKTGLMKKAHEFSVLCGVDALVIIFPSSSTSGVGSSLEPEIWPPNRDEVRRIIGRYRNITQEQRTKRTSGVSHFFERRKKKLLTDLEKAREVNLEARYPGIKDLLKGLSKDQLRKGLELVREKLAKKKEQARPETTKGSGHEFGVHEMQDHHSLRHYQMIHEQNINTVMQPPMLMDMQNNYLQTGFLPLMNMYEGNDPWMQCKGQRYYQSCTDIVPQCNSQHFMSPSNISNRCPMQHASYCITNGGFVHPTMEHGSTYQSNNTGILGTDNSTTTMTVNHVPLPIRAALPLKTDPGEAQFIAMDSSEASFDELWSWNHMMIAHLEHSI